MATFDITTKDDYIEKICNLPLDFKIADKLKTLMKQTISFLFLLFLTSVYSCQSQPIVTVFESTKIDAATGLNEPKIFILKKQSTNADFNYGKLNDVDGNIKDTLNLRNLMPIFEPTNGSFNYYQFIATFKGQGYNADGPPIIKDFHDILIIKTDKDNKIIDAFQYTLEWAEPPLQYDLFRASAKNITLTSGLNLNQMKFLRSNNFTSSNNELKDGGIIQLDTR